MILLKEHRYLKINYKTLGKKPNERYNLFYNAPNGDRWHIISSVKKKQITSMIHSLWYFRDCLEIK